MAKIRVKKTDTQTLLSVKLQGDEEIRNIDLENLESARIRALFDIKKEKERVLTYSAVKADTLDKRLKKPICKQDFFSIIGDIVDISRKLKEAHLDENKLLLGFKDVYYVDLSRELFFVYLPLLKALSKNTLYDFMEKFIYAVKPDKEDDMDYVARFTGFLSNIKDYSFDKIDEYIKKEIADGNRYNVIGDEAATTLLNDDTGIMVSEYEAPTPDDTGVLNNQVVSDPGFSYLGNSLDETGVLSSSSQPREPVKYPVIRRVKTGECIVLDKNPFRLGKSRYNVDYTITNNTSVSRNHAEIITRGGKCYIVDLDSTNSTFVNGKTIPCRQEIEIHNDDRIALSNEEFLFQF